MTSVHDLAWIDMLGLAIVGVFTILGLVRGLWWQVVRLVGIIVAVAVARLTSPRWSPMVAEHLPGLSPQLVHGITRVGIFLLALLAASLLGLIGKKFIEAIHLNLMDRVGGLVAGLATGIIVHAALLVGICELGSPEWSQRTVQGTQSQRLLYSLASRTHLILDAQAAERLRPWLEGSAPEEIGPEGIAPEGTAPQGTAPEEIAPEGIAPKDTQESAGTGPRSPVDPDGK